jgi:hypothetical protein
MKRKPQPKPTAERKFADGESVAIIRPSPLWSGCKGVVVGFEDGLHRVRIAAKPEGSTFNFFHADVDGAHLESDL